MFSVKGAKNPVVVKFADTQRDKDSRKKHDMPHHTSMGNGAGSMGGGGGGAYGPGGGSNTQYAQVTEMYVAAFQLSSIHA